MPPAMGEDSSAMMEAERLAAAERYRQQVLEKARQTEIRAREQTVPEKARQLARHARWLHGKARIVDFDPKQGGEYFNRIYCVDHATLDLDEESPLGPMRYTDRVRSDGRPYQTCAALNILAVKIGSSDIGFPIHVYGTVIARDTIDNKCLYLFNRDRNHCQIINSEDDSLILTGPKRGIALLDDDHVEMNLKVRGHGGQDRELSKGCISIKGVPRRLLDKCVVETKSLATRLSTVDVTYAVVKRAVEGTIAVEVLQGDFHGEITARTSSIKDVLVLHDSRVAGGMSATANGNGVVLQLMRSVVCVYVMDLLIIVVQTSDGKNERAIIEFTPKLNGGDEDVFSVGATEMRVKVTWSVIDF